MSSKENFNQAMFEMFGVGKDPKDNKNVANNTKKAKEEPKPMANTETKKETTVKTEAAAPVKPVYAKTVLAEGTVFEGNLNSKGDVEIAGIFKGDIATEGNAIIRSDVEGNVKAQNLDIISNVLTGNVTVAGNVNLAVGSQIKGNINADSIVASGKIIGDMVIENDASFDELSHVEGNITAKYITIHHGAYIDGKITIVK